MSELRIKSWTMPAADLGPESPLPPLRNERELHVVEKAHDVPQEMLDNMAYGHIPNILPYTKQDGYGRRRSPRSWRVAVLENEILRATFLLELGGRLWSLVHKPLGRELLYVNPVFQPANLAVRDAWFSGGVEWNIGVIGHSPFTCAPLFAARVQSPDGTPILRLYEWERIRQVPFQIDAYLPDGSPVLFVHVRIVNPHDHAIPMYWWSNIAVPETPDMRLIVPTDSAYRFGYAQDGLRRIPVPEFSGTDITYATNLGTAMDFFFHVPDERRPWITALDGAGQGLIQVSTARLRGRKLFLWGMNNGGRRWQEFLSGPGEAYIEIQAGLARTQMEHLAMPAGAEWSWLEAYGLLQADPVAVHGADWTQAQQVVENALEHLIPQTALDAEFARGADWVDLPSAELFQRGSGWGTLEHLRREALGEKPFCSTGLIFDKASLDEQQTPWLTLLRDGAFPTVPADAEAKGYMVQSEWRALLEKAVISGQNGNWFAWFHLGVMRYYTGERDDARHAWERSLEIAPTPWALRNLGIVAFEQGRFDDAVELYLAACRMRPSSLPLVAECGRILNETGRSHIWLEFLKELPQAIRIVGRIRLLEGQAALMTGDLAKIEALFADAPVVEDIREGEVSLSQLWFAYHEQRLSHAEHAPIDDTLCCRVRSEFPLPKNFDFGVQEECLWDIES